MIKFRCPNCKTSISRNLIYTISDNKIYTCNSCKMQFSLIKYLRISRIFGLSIGLFIVLYTKDMWLIDIAFLKDIISGLIVMFTFGIIMFLFPNLLILIEFYIKKNKLS
jgi:hypothetical protein